MAEGGRSWLLVLAVAAFAFGATACFGPDVERCCACMADVTYRCESCPLNGFACSPSADRCEETYASEEGWPDLTRECLDVACEDACASIPR